jgi:hypothetical protein
MNGQIIVAAVSASSTPASLNIAKKMNESYSLITGCDILLTNAIAEQKRTGSRIDADAEVYLKGEPSISETSRVNIGGNLSSGAVTGGTWFIIKQIASCDLLISGFLGTKLILVRDK